MRVFKMAFEQRYHIYRPFPRYHLPKSPATFLPARSSAVVYPNTALAVSHPLWKSAARPVVARSRPVRKRSRTSVRAVKPVAAYCKQKKCVGGWGGGSRCEEGGGGVGM